MTIYIGAYVRVPAVTRDESKTVLVCSATCKGSSRLSTSTRFCPECGTAVERRLVAAAVTRVLSANYAADEIAREYVDLMVSDNEPRGESYAAWIPNHHGFGQHLDNRESAEMPFASEAEREKETAKFLAHHGKFLAAVEAHFGIAPTVHYGVVVI